MLRNIMNWWQERKAQQYLEELQQAAIDTRARLDALNQATKKEDAATDRRHQGFEDDPNARHEPSEAELASIKLLRREKKANLEAKMAEIEEELNKLQKFGRRI